MKIREALYLSSVKKATYTVYTSNIPTNNGYHVLVDTLHREYTSDPAYSVTVARIIHDKIQAPHITHDEYTIDELEAYLQTWIDHDGWEPLEEPTA